MAAPQAVPEAMAFTSHDELILLGLLAAVAALMALAPTLRIPYPILLVAGGGALGFVPGVPRPVPPPPPLVLPAAAPLPLSSSFFSPMRGLRRHVLARRRDAALRRRRGRRDRGRSRRRLGGRVRPDPARQHPGRDRDFAPVRLPRLHPGECAPRLGRAGGGYGRRLSRLARAGAPAAPDAHAGDSRPGDARLPRGRAPLRPGPPPAAPDPRRALRALDREPD